MQAVAFRVLRTAQRPISIHACRTIAGVRHPISLRSFYRSSIYRIPNDPSISEGDENGGVETQATNTGIETSEGAKEVENLAVGERARNGRPGTGRIRGNRQRQPEGLPPVMIPDWFWARNVKCIGDPDLSDSLAVFPNATGRSTGNEEEPLVLDDAVRVDYERQEASILVSGLNSTKNAKYSIHIDVYQEIYASLAAGLSLRPPKSTNQPISRPITLLQCPKDGGIFYLDSVVETMASKLGADLIRLDATDLGILVGSYIDENPAWSRPRASVLGYETQKVAGKVEEYDKDTNAQDGESEEGEEDVMDTGEGRPNPPSLTFPKGSDLAKRLSSIFGALKKPKATSSPFQEMPIIDIIALPQEKNIQLGSASESDQWNGLKLNAVLDTLVCGADAKRDPSLDSTPPGTEAIESKPKDIIIQIRDYKEMTSTMSGSDLLLRLRIIVNKRWQDGRNIIIVGTTANEEAEPSLSRPEIQHLQSDIDGEKRTIFVPPERGEEQDATFESDDKHRIRNINIRHIEEMLSKMAEGTALLSSEIDIEKNLDSATVYSSGLEDAVWTFPRVHRLATTLLGLHINSPSSPIDGVKFNTGLKILASSDEAKFDWGAAELKEEDNDVEVNELAETKAKNQITKDKIKQIQNNCTRHEKKLLSGVVLPADIHTTFEQIRAPQETIDATKTLTTLSLLRPEAFSYGVLATDKIPGLLLYGPPGTGKTLLAKAVAKESGATMLEVSGADVNDMFVGEGEKNVKAVFSLAKKLSPCIVFIDEADSIFAARGEAKSKGSHRELINQFLREWDGMNDLSAFIMVATNRPFDLDEAVLRRLPRRLLVDLPAEKDREAILKIHLKDEMLDESVSLAMIAKDTPFYSGSDLKNVSIAAAMACIREENEAASKHTSEEPYVYPEKRILTKGHFDKAIDEISASISEDMSTLAAIRKFDEKYGDRKGRRKKGAGLGFGGTKVVEKDSEAARVRKMEV